MEREVTAKMRPAHLPPARLNALRTHFGELELPLVVCSHIDDDHIGGVLALVQDVELGALDITIECLWHNRPLDLVGEADEQKLAAILREDEHAERYASAWTKQFVDENWEIDPKRRRGYVRRRATSSRCQRRTVAGVTKRDLFHARRGSTWLNAASSARSTCRLQTSDLTLQHLQLMAEQQNLDLLLPLRTTSEHE
jgi:hypothetical protein